MFAVVQIGSKVGMSPCITARTVREAGGRGWPVTMAGAPSDGRGGGPALQNGTAVDTIHCHLPVHRR